MAPRPAPRQDWHGGGGWLCEKVHTGLNDRPEPRAAKCEVTAIAATERGRSWRTKDQDQTETDWRGWAYRTRTGESVCELCDWICVTTSPEMGQARRWRPFACKLRDKPIWPLRLGSVFRRALVGDTLHDAVGEGNAIDGLGKTPIVYQIR